MMNSSLPAHLRRPVPKAKLEPKQPKEPPPVHLLKQASQSLFDWHFSQLVALCEQRAMQPESYLSDAEFVAHPVEDHEIRDCAGHPETFLSDAEFIAQPVSIQELEFDWESELHMWPWAWAYEE